MIKNMIVNNFEDIFKKPMEIENLSSLYPKSFLSQIVELKFHDITINALEKSTFQQQKGIKLIVFCILTDKKTFSNLISLSKYLIKKIFTNIFFFLNDVMKKCKGF